MIVFEVCDCFCFVGGGFKVVSLVYGFFLLNKFLVEWFVFEKGELKFVF